MTHNNSTNICNYLIADVPFPPSINELKSLVKIGKGYRIGRSTKYKRYIRDAFEPFWLSVRQHGPVHFGDDAMIWSILCPPRSNCDTDNYNKCVQDCIEHVGAIDNDRYFVSHRVERGPRISGGLLRVFVANSVHRSSLTYAFEADFAEWLKCDYSAVLKPPESRLLRRAGFAAPVQSPAAPVPEGIALPF